MIKTANDYLTEWFPNVISVTKDRGDRGFFILYKNYDNENCYEYITKDRIIKCITRGEKNDRKIKLMVLQIRTE